MLIKRIEKTLFFLIVFFLPTQLGKHYWPNFSYVQGIRIDYLSPTLYFTDILIGLLFLLCLIRLTKAKCKLLSQNKLLILFFVILAVNVLISKSQEAAFYSLIKFAEFSFFALYTAKRFKKGDIKDFVDTLSLSVCLFVLLAVWQFLKQSSIGGLFYFLGERTFSGTTIGIANMSINNILILRPYSTFPHPNVLAFFLLFTNVIFLFQLLTEKDRSRKTFLLFVSIVSSFVLLFTFSRIIIVLYLLFLAYYLWKSLKIKQRVITYILLSLVPLVVYFINYYDRFFTTRFFLKDLVFRQELMSIAWLIFQRNILLGVGMKNFFYHEALYQKTISPIFLQPVHNIFLLVLCEIGILGFLFTILLFFKIFKNLSLNLKRAKEKEIKNFYQSIFFIFLALITVSCFDHFFLTVQQGQLMLALIIGLSFTKLRG